MGQKSLESLGFYGTFAVLIAGLCNGSTADSESACLGSNPSPATNKPFVFNVFQTNRTPLRPLRTPLSVRYASSSLGLTGVDIGETWGVISGLPCVQALSVGLGRFASIHHQALKEPLNLKALERVWIRSLGLAMSIRHQMSGAGWNPYISFG